MDKPEKYKLCDIRDTMGRTEEIYHARQMDAYIANLARRLHDKAKKARDLLIGYYSPDAIREGWVHLNDVIADLEQIVKEGE